MKKIRILFFFFLFSPATYANLNNILNSAGCVLLGAGVAHKIAGSPYDGIFIEGALATQLAQPVIEAVRQRKFTSGAASAMLYYAFTTALINKKDTSRSAELLLKSAKYFSLAYAKPKPLGIYAIPGCLYLGLGIVSAVVPR